MKPFKQRGGGEIGGREATWPISSITVEPGLLTVNVLGRATFTPEEVVVVEPIGFIPILSHGVRIHHTKKDCSADVCFFSYNRGPLIEAIAAAGFRIGKPPSPWGKPRKLG